MQYEHSKEEPVAGWGTFWVLVLVTLIASCTYSCKAHDKNTIYFNFARTIAEVGSCNELSCTYKTTNGGYLSIYGHPRMEGQTIWCSGVWNFETEKASCMGWGSGWGKNRELTITDDIWPPLASSFEHLKEE